MEIFNVVMESKLGLYYISSIIDDKFIKNPPINLNPTQKDKLAKWFGLYSWISSNSFDTDIFDPLTSSVQVVPYVLPMDSSGSFTGMCDKNIIESCIWDKKENPFTRSSIDIKELEQFNKLEDNVKKIAETKNKIKELIGQAKLT